MRAAIYARVSILDQEPENQLGELRAYAAARSWIPAEYVDRGVSGAKDRRPALDQLVADAKRRRFDVVVCWRLDRLGRNLRHLVTLIEELQYESTRRKSLRLVAPYGLQRACGTCPPRRQPDGYAKGVALIIISRQRRQIQPVPEPGSRGVEAWHKPRHGSPDLRPDFSVPIDQPTSLAQTSDWSTLAGRSLVPVPIFWPNRSARNQVIFCEFRAPAAAPAPRK
jgi:hypothetical protein